MKWARCLCKINAPSWNRVPCYYWSRSHWTLNKGSLQKIFNHASSRLSRNTEGILPEIGKLGGHAVINFWYASADPSDDPMDPFLTLLLASILFTFFKNFLAFPIFDHEPGIFGHILLSSIAPSWSVKNVDCRTSQTFCLGLAERSTTFFGASTRRHQLVTACSLGPNFFQRDPSGAPHDWKPSSPTFFVVKLNVKEVHLHEKTVWLTFQCPTQKSTYCCGTM